MVIIRYKIGYSFTNDYGRIVSIFKSCSSLVRAPGFRTVPTPEVSSIDDRHPRLQTRPLDLMMAVRGSCGTKSGDVRCRDGCGYSLDMGSVQRHEDNQRTVRTMRGLRAAASRSPSLRRAQRQTRIQCPRIATLRARTRTRIGELEGHDADLHSSTVCTSRRPISSVRRPTPAARSQCPSSSSSSSPSPGLGSSGGGTSQLHLGGTRAPSG